MAPRPRDRRCPGVAARHARSPFAGAALLAVIASSCQPDPLAVCGQAHALSAATDAALYLGLSEAQQNAVGFIRHDSNPARSSCSALLIASRWALTARHCTVDKEFRFGIGSDVAEPLALVEVVDIAEHEDLDLSLLELAPIPDGNMPVTPVPATIDALDERWLSVPVQAAGFGRTDTGSHGRRGFIVEPVAAIGSTTITIDGEGRSGACVGDSGGPLLTRDSDGQVRALGVLSVGSASCIGIDVYTRLDRAASWIAEHVDDDAVEGDIDCSALPLEGMCQRDVAIRCERGVLAAETCSGELHCGWDPSVSGYRCVRPDADPCLGVTSAGRCEGNTAFRCRQGHLEETRCARCAAQCMRSPATGVVGCGLHEP